MKKLGGFLHSLFRRRSCPVPTWRGWVLLAVVVVLPGIYGFRHVDGFLAQNEPLPDGVPVVEGWLPDYALAQLKTDLRLCDGHKIYVTGGPVEEGGPLSQYKNLADLGAAVLVGMGVDSNCVQSVPTPLVFKDRTYTSAMALRAWFQKHGGIPKKINLISMGAHSRRSHMLFAAAFGKEVEVGVTAIEDRGYDPHHWWRTSQGVRTVVSEFVAYLYARFLFSD